MSEILGVDEFKHVIIELDEVKLYKFTNLEDGGISLIFHIQKDDASIKLWEYLLGLKHRYFHLIAAQKDPDIHHSRGGKQTSDSTTTVGKGSASGGVLARTQSTALKLAHKACREVAFQGWCLDTFADGNSSLKDPVAREEFAKQQIYEICEITSRSELVDGSLAAQKFMDMYRDFENETRVL